MRVDPLVDHTCNLYCRGPRHAVPAIAVPTLSAKDVQRGYAQHVEPHGWRVVGVRPAPEADVEAWRQQMGWGWNPTTNHIHRSPDTLPAEVVGWLAFIEPAEETTCDTP